MKYNKFFSYAAIFLGTLLIFGCNAGSNSGSGASKDANFDKDASYALGYLYGTDWKDNGVIPDFNEVLKGIKAAYGMETPRISSSDVYMVFNEAVYALQAEKTEENRQEEIDFLAQNSGKEGIIITPSGLQYEVISEGRGVKPGPEDTVRLHYEASLVDGTVFDSTYDGGELAEFSLSEIMPGLGEGLQLMSESASYRFYIPSELAYGPWGNGSTIPPYAALVFKVDLISIVR
jgi:FKBP-type peptidyl-prolyl cis-trans isomerase FklB